MDLIYVITVIPFARWFKILFFYLYHLLAQVNLEKIYFQLVLRAIIVLELLSCLHLNNFRIN